MKYEKSCGAVIFKDSYVLLIQNKKSNHWSFPKGHIEKGESDVETAYREVQEETGVHILINEKCFEVISYSPALNVSKDVVYFYADYISGEITPQFEEIADIGWYLVEDALKIITYDQEKQVLVNIVKKKRA